MGSVRSINMFMYKYKIAKIYRKEKLKIYRKKTEKVKVSLEGMTV